ncbi:MAG: GNAT family N-acetyltransferase [Jannaschia sp.]
MIPVLTTDRLALRGATMADFASYAAFYASDTSAIIGGPIDTRAAWKRFAADAGHWALKGFGWWTVVDADGPAGVVGFHHPEGTPDVELGWVTYPRATLRGYAVEAAGAALAWAGGRWSRIVSNIDTGNTASVRVAARLGATDTRQAPAHDPACTIWLHRRRVA